jgi:hypothetical protein
MKVSQQLVTSLFDTGRYFIFPLFLELRPHLFLSLHFFLSLFTIFYAQTVASGLQSPVKKNQPDKIDLQENKTCSEALKISI